MTVFYLKYRPKKIADLDLAEVRQSLKKIFSSDITPQSFLFSGPKGSGKTSAARIVARIVNCEKPVNGEACGKCKNCKLIDSGRANLDIIEMDAASNRGIDEVRNLKERIFSSPVSLSNKVFVIDEVHMMTKEAFNAFLKILEEPPSNVYFIMCTTNPEKIPETVMSRLVRVDFTKSSQDEMGTSLKKVIEGEGIEMGDDLNFIMEAIGSLSEGSFRNGQKILMELVLSKGKKISKKDWLDFSEKKYARGFYEPNLFENDLKEGKTGEILNNLELMAESGVDLSLYRQRLVEYFQKKMIDFYKGGNVSGLTAQENSFFLRLLINASRDEKNTVLPQLPIQLAVIDFMVKSGGGSEGEKQEIKEEKKEKKSEIKMKIGKPQARVKVEDVYSKWKELLAEVKPYNHSVEAFLRAARPVGVIGDRVEIEVFYKFHKERLEDSRNRKIVEKGLENVLGVPLVFDCRLADKGTPVDLPAEKSAQDSEIYDVVKDIFG